MNVVRYARRLAGVGFCAVLLAGCAHQTPQLDARQTGLPATAELADTPFFPQARYQCGPAALATVLNARGVTVAPEQLVSQVYLPGREGSLQAEIVAATRQHGLLPVAVAPSLEALLAEVAAGHPVLVLQNLGLNWMPRWHYAVVVGYDLDRQVLVLRSGTEARRVTPFGVFLNTWDRSKRWGIVALTPGSLPARAEPTAYLAAASALESLGKRQQARDAYRAATERWPENPIAWLGLGNTDYALGGVRPAETAFRRALALQADAAIAWNNLAHVLAARQCVERGREAARCAQRIAPDNSAFADTVTEMARQPVPGAGRCALLPACPAR